MEIWDRLRGLIHLRVLGIIKMEMHLTPRIMLVRLNDLKVIVILYRFRNCV